jgi:hypothetical protein
MHRRNPLLSVLAQALDDERARESEVHDEECRAANEKEHLERQAQQDHVIATAEQALAKYLQLEERRVLALERAVQVLDFHLVKLSVEGLRVHVFK